MKRIYCVILLMLLGIQTALADRNDGAYAYLQGDYETAYNTMISLAKTSEDKIAQYYLGIMYMKGQGVEQDYEKAGEIIPQVVSVITDKRTDDVQQFLMPKTCPCCGTPVVKKEAFYKCENFNCTEKIKSRIRYFVHRDAMDIDGIGKSLVEQLVDADLLKNYSDLYFLNFDDVVKLEKMAEKSTNNLLKGIEDSKARTLARLIYALGIDGVGVRTGEILEAEFATLSELMEADKETLEAIDEIGPIIADNIIDFFNNEDNMKIVNRLIEAGVNTNRLETGEEKQDFFNDMTFVVTGTLQKYSRKEISDKIKSLGGKTSSSISAKTSYLVAGESAGSKLNKAKKLSVKILTEDDFEKLVNSMQANDVQPNDTNVDTSEKQNEENQYIPNDNSKAVPTENIIEDIKEEKKEEQKNDSPASPQDNMFD